MTTKNDIRQFLNYITCHQWSIFRDPSVGVRTSTPPPERTIEAFTVTTAAPTTVPILNEKDLESPRDAQHTVPTITPTPMNDSDLKSPRDAQYSEPIAYFRDRTRARSVSLLTSIDPSEWGNRPRLT